ncbi:hypothetical protein [Eudoraea chungangensis]|uniref:hypothetical protein n=1 Tax=Eudoraea chungangensis TaxID=1481905 RepID=UPI0023EB7D1D|nr:hypothetical protein [Eudoraea chungangensis]
MRFIIPLLAFLLISTLSCKDEVKKNEVNLQMKEVMAIHDEVMPKMSELSTLVATLKRKADSTANGKEYKDAMEDLQDAHKEMMDWMKEFGDRFNYDEILNGASLSSEKKKWLKEEKKKIKKVKKDILKSIEKAKKLLE